MINDLTLKIEIQLTLIIEMIKQLNSHQNSMSILTQTELLKQLNISPNT